MSAATYLDALVSLGGRAIGDVSPGSWAVVTFRGPGSSYFQARVSPHSSAPEVSGLVIVNEADRAALTELRERVLALPSRWEPAPVPMPRAELWDVRDYGRT